LLAEMVVFGGVMIVELGVASLGQLLFFVSVQVVVYRFFSNTDAEDRTLTGYLMAVLKGELDVVGFKLLSGAVKELGGFVAGQLVTRELVGEVATQIDRVRLARRRDGRRRPAAWRSRINLPRTFCIIPTARAGRTRDNAGNDSRPASS
jgi:hypothetical protein